MRPPISAPSLRPSGRTLEENLGAADRFRQYIDTCRGLLGPRPSPCGLRGPTAFSGPFGSPKTQAQFFSFRPTRLEYHPSARGLPREQVGSCPALPPGCRSCKAVQASAPCRPSPVYMHAYFQPLAASPTRGTPPILRRSNSLCIDPTTPAYQFRATSKRQFLCLVPSGAAAHSA